MIFVLMEIKCDIENKRSRSYNLYIAQYFKDRINSDIYTPYDEMPIHINGKFTMGKLKSPLCRKGSFSSDRQCPLVGVGGRVLSHDRTKYPPQIKNKK